MTAVDSRCACPPGQTGLCDDCVGLVEHLNHQTPRLCAYPPCSRPLARRDTEKPSHFATRKFCNQVCAARNSAGSVFVEDIRERDCVCGGVMRRRDNESLARFTGRRFCSPSCAARNADRKPPQKKPVAARRVETKTCAHCGSEFHRRDREGAEKWGTREACSVGCGAKLRRAKEITARMSAGSGRVCAYPGCGKPLVPRLTEPAGRFAERRFCNRSCGTANRNIERTRVAETGLPAQRECAGCGAVMVWDRPRIPPYQWRVKRFCSPGCSSRARAENPAPRKPPRKPAAPAEPAPVVRPRPEDLLPDPAVVDMDRKRRRADTLLDEGIPAERVAAELGVSVALVRRWDRGDQ